jgi:hypothetical protein
MVTDSADGTGRAIRAEPFFQVVKATIAGRSRKMEKTRYRCARRIIRKGLLLIDHGERHQVHRAARGINFLQTQRQDLSLFV